jgi:hypothetical protein
MLINASSINSVALNGQLAGAGGSLSEALADDLAFNTTSNYLLSYLSTATSEIVLNTTADSLSYLLIIDSLNVSDVTKALLSDIVVLEVLLLNTSVQSTAQFHLLVTEYITVLDNLGIVINASITDSISMLSPVTNFLNNITTIAEVISLNTSLSTKVTFLNTIVDLIKILDSAELSNLLTIVDSMLLQTTIQNLYVGLANTISNILINTTVQNTLAHLMSISDSLLLDENLSSKAILSALLEDVIIIRLPESEDTEKYSTFLYSPETSAVTEYSNYNFKGCARFLDNYLFYNDSGLYKRGGSKDDGADVVAKIALAGLTFGTSNLKSIPSAYLGVSNSDSIILRVSVDGKAQVYYQLNKHTEDLHTQKIALGKGLIGRYFQFELITSADTFNLESIEFLPIMLNRKI